MMVIFRNKIQYAIFHGYVFERLYSGQINMSNPYVEKKMVITDQNILVDGVYIEYEVVKKKRGVYDIEFRNEDGESFLGAEDFTISNIKFQSNTDDIEIGGKTYSMSNVLMNKLKLLEKDLVENRINDVTNSITYAK
ncbi:MAG TPA: hypothetical protein IAC41_08055 [Candidatus Merdenecus merdavium]|nr:hypothetical protein [Candidatus Merdenecus merdavium]